MSRFLRFTGGNLEGCLSALEPESCLGSKYHGVSVYGVPLYAFYERALVAFRGQHNTAKVLDLSSFFPLLSAIELLFPV